MKTSRWVQTMAVILMGLTAASGAYAQEYALHARVSYDTGNTMIKGKDDADWSQAPTNTLVLPGDMFWVDRSGNMELELSGGAFLRLADGSKAELVSLPPSGRIKGWVGSFYVHRIERSTDQMILETPACQVTVAKDSVVRVDVLEQGATTVSVHLGQAIVIGANGSQTVANAGERCWADPGLLPSEVAAFDRKAEDDFDAWNRQRIDVLLYGIRTLPKAVTVSSNTLGYADLAGSGEWIEVDTRSYWRPTVSVDFVPYRHGHWSFVMGIGHTWVEDYPFGYITSHYGRWGYFPAHGWLWSYDPVWSPAWVATVRCGDYYVWTPVDYYYRPVVVTQSAFFSIGGVNFGLSASSYVPVTYLYGGPRYVNYCTPTVVSYVERHYGDVNIWNINVGSRNHVSVPYDTSLAGRVRDYSPRRSIRGPISMEQNLPTASTRVAKLETGMGRTTFARESAAGTTPSVRTRVTDTDRASRVRTVSLSQTAPSLAPSVRGRSQGERSAERAPLRDAAPATRGARIETPKEATDRTSPSRGTDVRRAERGAEISAPNGGRATRTEAGTTRTPVATVDMDQSPSTPPRRTASVPTDARGRTSTALPERTQRTPQRSGSSASPAPEERSSSDRGSAGPARSRRTEDRPSVRAPESPSSAPVRERTPQREVTPSVRPTQSAEPRTATRSSRPDTVIDRPSQSAEPRRSQPSVRPSQSVEPRRLQSAPERPSIRPSQSFESRPSRPMPERPTYSTIERPSSPAPQMRESARQEAPRPSPRSVELPQMREPSRPSPHAAVEGNSGHSSSERSNAGRGRR